MATRTQSATPAAAAAVDPQEGQILGQRNLLRNPKANQGAARWRKDGEASVEGRTLHGPSRRLVLAGRGASAHAAQRGGRAGGPGLLRARQPAVDPPESGALFRAVHGSF